MIFDSIMLLQKILIIATVFVCMYSNMSMASTVDKVYHDWVVFKSEIDINGMKCFIGSFPIDSVGNHSDQREAYLLLTIFRDRKVEEISVNSGYEYKLNSKIYVSVNDNQHKLFTNEDTAWALTAMDDRLIISQMLDSQDGSLVKVRGESSKGTYSVDTYSLSGIRSAYEEIKRNCVLKDE